MQREKRMEKRTKYARREQFQRLQYIFVMTIPERKERNKKYLKE